ncbi:TPA: hypothetical protein ACGX1J_001640 [Listeria monocytogenes]
MKQFLYIFWDLRELNNFVDKVIKTKGDLITKNYSGWCFELGDEVWHLRPSHSANIFARKIKLDGFLFSVKAKNYSIEGG